MIQEMYKVLISWDTNYCCLSSHLLPTIIRRSCHTKSNTLAQVYVKKEREFTIVPSSLPLSTTLSPSSLHPNHSTVNKRTKNNQHNNSPNHHTSTTTNIKGPNGYIHQTDSPPNHSSPCENTPPNTPPPTLSATTPPPLTGSTLQQNGISDTSPHTQQTQTIQTQETINSKLPTKPKKRKKHKTKPSITPNLNAKPSIDNSQDLTFIPHEHYNFTNQQSQDHQIPTEFYSPEYYYHYYSYYYPEVFNATSLSPPNSSDSTSSIFSSTDSTSSSLSTIPSQLPSDPPLSTFSTDPNFPPPSTDSSLYTYPSFSPPPDPSTYSLPYPYPPPLESNPYFPQFSPSPALPSTPTSEKQFPLPFKPRPKKVPKTPTINSSTTPAPSDPHLLELSRPPTEKYATYLSFVKNIIVKCF